MSRVRYLGRRLPWISVLPSNPYLTPLSLPRDKALNWYWRYSAWAAVLNLTLDGDITYSGSANFALNVQNNAFLTGTPFLSESDLPLGWEVDADLVIGPSGNIFTVRLFSKVLTPSNYGGAQYPADIDGDIAPLISLSTSPSGGTDGSSSPLNTNVTCTMDGENIPWYGPSGESGTIDIIPAAYWPYLKANLTAPVYDVATGTQLLNPHQTDELPSSS